MPESITDFVKFKMSAAGPDLFDDIPIPMVCSPRMENEQTWIKDLRHFPFRALA